MYSVFIVFSWDMALALALSHIWEMTCHVEFIFLREREKREEEIDIVEGRITPSTHTHKDIYTECSEPVAVLAYIAKGLYRVLP